jgi:hypothetical protein
MVRGRRTLQNFIITAQYHHFHASNMNLYVSWVRKVTLFASKLKFRLFVPTNSSSNNNIYAISYAILIIKGI